MASRKDAKTRRLARRIARDIFTFGNRATPAPGNARTIRANRLVVEWSPGKIDGTGYCEEAIRDIIHRHLVRASAVKSK